IAADAGAGDPVALAAFARGGRALGAAFAATAVLCDIDRVVLGGGVAQSGALLLDAVEAGFREFAGLGFARRVAVVPAELGGSAGLVGAAALLHRPDRYSLVPRAAVPLPHP
ncbi:ROK family protein, partial [Kineococcus glutinatus]|uniref:ROK family protein n=1 Tax=Kineococcus glutinatus TaxID=1070872 RepID=UPI0031F0EC87